MIFNNFGLQYITTCGFCCDLMFWLVMQQGYRNSGFQSLTHERCIFLVICLRHFLRNKKTAILYSCYYFVYFYPEKRDFFLNGLNKA